MSSDLRIRLSHPSSNGTLILIIIHLLTETLRRTSPLPYFALSNLLTLFSHDMPTLPLVQHVFDYLLCRPPIYIVYLATVVRLSFGGQHRPITLSRFSFQGSKKFYGLKKKVKTG